MKVYDKLVRDMIPDIIAQNGETPVIHTASDAEYWQRLKEKLLEEVTEFIEDESKSEMADVLEVIYAICKYKGFDLETVEKLRFEKKVARG